jgi:asparagine synthase (glutamine-hydrolysing)
MVFPELPECDESDYIRAVASHLGLDSIVIPYRGFDGDRYQAFASKCRDFADYPNDFMGCALLDAASARGHRVLLTGYGGDEWLAPTPPGTFEVLRSQGLICAARRLAGELRERGPYRATRALLRQAVEDLAPASIRARFGRWHWQRRLPWIRPDFAEATGLYSARAEPEHPGGFVGDRAEMYRVLHAGWWVHGTEIEERRCAHLGVEQRSPLLDRRVIELCFAMPDSQRRAAGTTKRVLRQAMGSRLPPAVAARSDKASFDPVFVDAIASRAEIPVPAAARRWLDIDSVANFRRAARAGETARVRPVFGAWATIEMSRWAAGLGPTDPPC